LLAVLMFFVDFMIRSSSLPFASEWGDLAAEENEADGDNKFFKWLDESLADRSEPATQRLAVYYTCLGLGFSGTREGQTKYLRQKMLELSARLRSLIGSDAATRVCPEAYENVNTDNLIQPPSSSLVGVLIALVGMTVVLFVANVWLFRRSKSDLQDNVNAIIRTEQSEGAATSGSAPAGNRGNAATPAVAPRSGPGTSPAASASPVAPGAAAEPK
jgi:type VI protein secretion system component VasF